MWEMYIMRKICILFMALLCTSVAYAQTSQNGFTDCKSPVSSASIVGAASLKAERGRKLCFDFDSGFGTASSSSFVVSADAAKICLDPDRGGTGGAAIVDIQVCPTSDPAGDNTCADTGLTLNGSNPCEAVVRGSYRYEVTTAPTGTQDAQITAEGY